MYERERGVRVKRYIYAEGLHFSAYSVVELRMRSRDLNMETVLWYIAT